MPLTVVIADDANDSLATLEDVLKAGGHTVRRCADGGDALARIERERPDVAILDIEMPVIDGLGVARAVRAQPWGRDVTLIAMTGLDSPSDARSGRDAGFDFYLLKPAQPRLLEAILAVLALRARA